MVLLLFLGPALLVFAAMTAYPMLRTVYDSFFTIVLTANSECPCLESTPTLWRGFSHGQNQLRRVFWSRFTPEACPPRQFARLRRQGQLHPSVARIEIDPAPDAPSQRATVTRAIR